MDPLLDLLHKPSLVPCCFLGLPKSPSLYWKWGFFDVTVDRL